MPVFKSETNRVVADEPEPDDQFVRVTWHGPREDGPYLRPFHGPLMPVRDYKAAVAWAVGIADQMRFPLYVVPLTGAQALADERVKGALAKLTDQERGELRRFVVTTLADVMRDCDDPAVRTDAHNLLADLGVIAR